MPIAAGETNTLELEPNVPWVALDYRNCWAVDKSDAQMQVRVDLSGMGGLGDDEIYLTRQDLEQMIKEIDNLE